MTPQTDYQCGYILTLQSVLAYTANISTLKGDEKIFFTGMLVMFWHSSSEILWFALLWTVSGRSVVRYLFALALVLRDTLQISHRSTPLQDNEFRVADNEACRGCDWNELLLLNGWTTHTQHPPLYLSWLQSTCLQHTVGVNMNKFSHLLKNFKQISIHIFCGIYLFIYLFDKNTDRAVFLLKTITRNTPLFN